jgi:succinate dehydrogenase / fumarate reductase cytochrome b subunit
LGGYVFAMILMLGFLFIPIYIFLTNGTGSLIAY